MKPLKEQTCFLLEGGLNARIGAIFQLAKKCLSCGGDIRGSQRRGQQDLGEDVCNNISSKGGRWRTDVAQNHQGGSGSNHSLY
eukprot:1499515-Ditylum_brightwellii.AAC.1